MSAAPLFLRVSIPLDLLLVKGNVEQNCSEFHRAIAEIGAAAARRLGPAAYDYLLAVVRMLADVDARRLQAAVARLEAAAERAASAPEVE